MTNGSIISMDVFKAVTQAISRSEQLDVMCSHLAQLLVASLEIKACAIYALEPDTGELERLTSFGLSMAYINKGRILAQKSITECMEGTPVIVSDISGDDRIQYPEEARSEGIAAIVSIPIRVSGIVLGTLRLYHDRVWKISEEDLGSLMLLAEFVGLAMNYTTMMNALCEISDLVDRTIPAGLVRQKCR